MKILKFVGALLFLAVTVFLVRNGGLFQGNTEMLRGHRSALSVDLNHFSSSMGEKEVQQFLPDLGLKCTDTDPDFSLGNRACYASLDSFNGIEAKQIAFFFREKQLANFKIDIPWKSHQIMIDGLRKDYGFPAGEQREPHSGVRLMGWKIKGGNLLYNLDKDQDVSMWNSLLWISHKEAKVMGGIFQGNGE